MHFNPIKMPSLSQWLEHGIEDIEVYNHIGMQTTDGK